MYLTAKRIYRNKSIKAESPTLRDVIQDVVTLQSFDVGGHRGTWRGSPFAEIESRVPLVPDEIKHLRMAKVDKTVAIPAIFAAITDSIERSWRQDKFHVIFHSSGNDSRMISSAIQLLVRKHGHNWLGKGLMFLSNRWEAQLFYAIMAAQGWDTRHYVAMNAGPDNEHYSRGLDFTTYWRSTNAPTPCTANFRWYLVAWAQDAGYIPSDDDDLQGYTGLWCNETWESMVKGGVSEWLSRHNRWYSYNQMATIPWKVPLMEHPLSDTEVIKLLPSARVMSGDALRRAVADYAFPDGKAIPRTTLDDWHHPISQQLRTRCLSDYSNSWYGKNVRRDLHIPAESGWSNEWGWYGLASLCEELIKDGMKINV